MEIIGSVYEPVEKIGSGGGGVVYLANHLRLGKKVVMKADKRKLTAKPEALRREVDVLKELSHTYIPQVYDFFALGDTVYTVMDYIDGESLDKPLKRGEVFDQKDVIKWAVQLLEALSYLHSPTHGDPPHGIVHSDIKPANIMLRNSGDICLIDFNIALAIGEDTVIGRSEGYASPEHYGIDLSFSSESHDENAPTDILDADTELLTEKMSTNSSSSSSSRRRKILPDVRSDIYSLGATLYHLLSGVKPAKNAVDVLPLSAEDFSAQIVKIITKAMNPNPDLRYQSADEMLYDITHLRENDSRLKRLKGASRITAGVLSLALIGGAFTAFTGMKRIQSAQNYEVLTEYSQNAMAAGDVKTALSYALAALPQKRTIFDAKPSPRAERALTDALGVYDMSDGYKSHAVMSLPSETIKASLSPDGSVCAAIDASGLTLADTESGEIIKSLPIEPSALSDAVFTKDNILIYASKDGLSAYDIANDKTLWTGEKATGVTLSADGKTVAAVNRGDDRAFIYDIDGTKTGEIPFEGKSMKALSNDTFGDPDDDIFKLSGDGKYLAVSFSNGGLNVFDTTSPEDSVEIYDVSDYTRFEGGFFGKYFAFSSTNDSDSVFSVVDMEELSVIGGFEDVNRFGVFADESGIYVSSEDVLVKLDPESGEQEEVGYASGEFIKKFDVCESGSAVITENKTCLIFDKAANMISRLAPESGERNFVNISGDFVIIAGRDTNDVRIFKNRVNSNLDVLNYDPAYKHDEARVYAGGTRAMLFSYEHFRIYDKEGNVCADTDIPNPNGVRDQQTSENGNLAVIYDDALRIYSGEDGTLLFEKTNLKSVFYAKYGLSVLDGNGNLSLIDCDLAKETQNLQCGGEYGAYCGTVVDDKLLNGRKLIGASKQGEKYFFVLAGGEKCTLCSSDGKELFDMAFSSDSMTEAFFTNNAVIISPLHGTPAAYDIKTGAKINDLDKDSYLTYVDETEEYVICRYMSTDAGNYAVAVDKKSFEPEADIPNLADIDKDKLFFDGNSGALRENRLYNLSELIDMAEDKLGIT